MNTLNSLQEVSSKLNEKYSNISDFFVYTAGDTVRGGFYKINHNENPCGSYYFHETFGRLSDHHNVRTYNELFIYLDSIIQSQLKWQKTCDENYAKEHNKKVEYKYDYSVILNGVLNNKVEIYGNLI